MKKLMFAAVAAISTVALADELNHEDITAKAEGFYDVTITTKHLAHAEKTVSKTFKTSSTKGTAYDQLQEHLSDVTNYAGFTVISGGIEGGDTGANKISIKYSYFANKDGEYTTKVVSKSSKGIYDAKTGKVYLWDTADKKSVTEEYRLDDAKVTGYVAYEVPLNMHKQFVATDDRKAAGGFTGEKAKAKDGSTLDFQGLTAFGTGTLDKDDVLKTVSGNVAGKYPDDIKFGCYGTWKINKDTKSYANLNAALVKKGCVELVEKASEK